MRNFLLRGMKITGPAFLMLGGLPLEGGYARDGLRLNEVFETIQLIEDNDHGEVQELVGRTYFYVVGRWWL